MKKWLLYGVGLFLLYVIAHWVSNYAIYITDTTYQLATFSVKLIVVCTGVIVFFIEKNGLQTRKKIQDEFDELHERLQKEKQEKEKPKDKDFTFVHPQENPDAQSKGNC